MTLKFLPGLRLSSVAVAAIGLTIALATPAMAHTPILLKDRDVLPWSSPLVVDGTDPIAMFGLTPDCPSIRSAQFRMQADQQIFLAYGIPDEAPENQLPGSSLPTLILIAPYGQVTVLQPTIRQVISPDGLGFTMQLLLVSRYSATAMAGTYSLMLVGGCPATRVTVALGSDPGDFDGVLRGKVATTDQLEKWYNNTPPSTDSAHGR